MPKSEEVQYDKVCYKKVKIWESLYTVQKVGRSSLKVEKVC